MNEGDFGRELFGLLTETVEDYGIFAMDKNGCILHWNAGAERTLGFSAEEAIGRRFHLIFTEEDIEQQVPEQELRIAAATGRADNERWHLRKGGERFWAVGVTVAIREADGRLRGFGKILRDRSDLKQLQEALEDRSAALTAAGRQKDIFLAKLAHELRNPLLPIQYCADMLRKQRAPEFLRLADLVERQVKQVDRMVEDLLDITRISRGILRLNRQPIDLRSLLKGAHETVCPLLESRRHHFYSFLPERPVTVFADPDRLQQVLVNLLRNAAQYTPAGGEISMRLQREGEKAVVRVVDNGIGIEADHMEHLFELFSQGDPASEASRPGLGIGLGLAHDLVNLHDGTIQARSEGRGKGSEFIVRLPMATESA